MYLRKNLRALSGHTYDPADYIVPTDDENLELAHLDTSTRGGAEVDALLELFNWPSSFVLRVRLIPVPFSAQTQNIGALYKSNDVCYAEVPFYDARFTQGSLENSCCEAVEMLFEDTGFYMQEKEKCLFKGFQVNEFIWSSLHKERPELLYRKPFPIQTVSAVACHQLHKGAGKWIIGTHKIKEGKVNEMPIFSYGGYYQSEQALEKCVPIYATLSSVGDSKTVVVLKSQLFWHEKSVFEGHPAKVGDTTYYFHDTVAPEEGLSISAAIASGYVQINVEQGQETKRYKSFRYEHTSLSRETVDITFIPIN